MHLISVEAALKDECERTTSAVTDGGSVYSTGTVSLPCGKIKEE